MRWYAKFADIEMEGEREYTAEELSKMHPSARPKPEKAPVMMYDRKRKKNKTNLWRKQR